MTYEIKLADGDSIYYQSDLSFEELKSFIASHDFIELPRSGCVSTGIGAWKRVPKLASYQTKSIVYVDCRNDLDEGSKREKLRRESVKPIAEQIVNYIPNRRMKLWSWWHESDVPDDVDGWCQYTEESLIKVLEKLKKFKCKTVV